MPKPLVSRATTAWSGNLFAGSGTTKLASSGVASFDVAWKNRAEAHEGTTNPEELLAAAHATCFSMALSNELDGNGTPPEKLDTAAEVTFVAGEGITGIKLTVTATVPGISAEDFEKIAQGAKVGCPVSQALKSVEISLDATLA